MTGFQSPIDISNRALDHAGGRAITSFSDGSRNAVKCAEIYDKRRQALLRRNYWVFATRKAALRPIDTTTMQLLPNPYSSDTLYNIGDLALYNDEFYIAMQATTGGTPPVDANGGGNSTWDNYFGPLTVDAWQATTGSPDGSYPTTYVFQQAYHAGELAYIAPGNGTVSVFLSLVDNNTDDPLGADPWNLGSTYMLGQVVAGVTGTLYQSVVSLNTGNNPDITVGVPAWVSGTGYTAGEYVFYTDGQIYQALGSTTGNIPPLSPSKWLGTGMWANTWSTTLSPLPRATSNNWHFVACTLVPLNIVFPMGAGPACDRQSYNVYLLPSNYLHRAPVEEALGNTGYWLGAQGGQQPQDWKMQGQYIISAEFEPIICRFVSDFQNVIMMDPLFCEMLAADVGSELCETLTQKPELKAACMASATKAQNDAQLCNAIEVGPVTQDEDEWIRVRY